MNYFDSIEDIANIATILLLTIVGVIIYRLKIRQLHKLILAALMFLLATPTSIVTYSVVSTILAKAIPQNRIVGCVNLDQYNCKRRFDCRVIDSMGGLGTQEPPLCMPKKDIHRTTTGR